MLLILSFGFVFGFGSNTASLFCLLTYPNPADIVFSVSNRRDKVSGPVSETLVLDSERAVLHQTVPTPFRDIGTTTLY